MAVADEAGERAQGLMGVTDLGSLRGMLFVFPEDTISGFWMKGTPLALDIAFFADVESGAFPSAEESYAMPEEVARALLAGGGASAG